MSSATLYRLSGGILVIGCVVMVVGSLVISMAGSDLKSSLLASGWFVWAIGAMLVTFGLPAIYVRQAEYAGALGLAGVVGITLFLITHGIFLGLLQGLVLPVIATKAPAVANRMPAAVGLAALVGALLLLIGSLSMGFATIRAGAFPRGAGALIIAGGLAVFIGHPILDVVEEAGYVLLMAGFAWLGLSLLSTQYQPLTAESTAPSAVR